MSKFFKVLVFGLVSLSFLTVSCVPPTNRSSGSIGDADHENENGDVGSNPSLSAPSGLQVKNHQTTTDKFLTLEWQPISDATSYKVYRAVYPAHTYASGSLDDKAYKLLVTIPSGSITTYQHNIPHLPLRRYAYRVTSVNKQGQSKFSTAIDGWRLPSSAEEALQDIDYTMHFAQSAIPDFGAQGLEEIVSGRASGQYHYASKMTNIKNNFSYYVDFEVVLNGTPKMSISLYPLGTKMNGDIVATGLYNAKITYHDLLGVIGGLTQAGSLTIEYSPPGGPVQTRTYSYSEANPVMKTVALSKDEIQPKPPATEWNEADPGYARLAARATL